MASKENINVDNGIAGMSEDLINEYREAFDLFDEDKNGKIDKNELKKMMDRLGRLTVSDADLMDTINDFDKNGDGEIDFDEFLLMMCKVNNETNNEECLKEAFNIFDLDHNGFISREELEIVMNRLGEHMKPEDLDNMMKQADTNGDGEVDFEEFKKMMDVKNFIN